MRELIAAQLKVLELEEALVTAKDDGTLTQDLKLELRDARRLYRELRSGGTANPDVVNTKVVG